MPSGTLLVTGAAGTGKTAVLRERFARLVEGGADPDRVALVVGSSSAREAARVSLLQRLPASLPGLHVVTMHGLANRILKQRAEAAGEGEPPQLLSATDQFAKVQELLAAQDPSEWPAYGPLLGMRGFADEVRQFLSRAQEALLTPEQIAEAADRRGLSGWRELARFLGEYQEVLDALNVADFATLLQRAAAEAPQGEPLVRPPARRRLPGHDGRGRGHPARPARSRPRRRREPRRARLLVPGNEPGPARPASPTCSPARSTSSSRRSHRARERRRRSRRGSRPHTSEEHAAIARELRRLHVEHGVAWNDMAVVVRRQGAHLGGLLRALDDARIPRAMPERGLSLTAEPATRPYVLALRWLVADEPEREELIEQLLVSDVVGLSPAAARGLLRVVSDDHRARSRTRSTSPTASRPPRPTRSWSLATRSRGRRCSRA